MKYDSLSDEFASKSEYERRASEYYMRRHDQIIMFVQKVRNKKYTLNKEWQSNQYGLDFNQIEFDSIQNKYTLQLYLKYNQYGCRIGS